MNEIRGSADGAGLRIALVASRFNEQVMELLVKGARDCLLEHGVADDAIDLIRVPGAWELPAATREVLGDDGYAAVVALGCVIRGETPHFDYVAGGAANGLGRLAVEAAVPITFGVLTTDNLEQAMARAGGRGVNKGWDAALAALEMASLVRRLRDGRANA